MPDTLSLDDLARQWREDPTRTGFAALADGLRKRGALAEATAVVRHGLATRPADIPGLVVLSRILLEQGDSRGAEQALREAVAVDPGHPVVRRLLGHFGDLPEPEPELEPELEPDESDALLFSDEGPAEALADPLLTESLAVLYHRQGHLERATEVYDALLARDPANVELRARRDRIAVEAEGRRPRPYDAAVSGGRPLREWLAALAAVTPPASRQGTAYDAFFQTSSVAPPPEEMADFAAFQAWLKGLDR